MAANDASGGRLLDIVLADSIPHTPLSDLRLRISALEMELQERRKHPVTFPFACLILACGAYVSHAWLMSFPQQRNYTSPPPSSPLSPPWRLSGIHLTMNGRGDGPGAVAGTTMIFDSLCFLHSPYVMCHVWQGGIETNGNLKRVNEYLNLPVSKPKGSDVRTVEQLLQLIEDARTGKRVDEWFHISREFMSSPRLDLVTDALRESIKSDKVLRRSAFRIADKDGSGIIDHEDEFAALDARVRSDVADRMLWDLHHREEHMTSAYLRFARERSSFPLLNETDAQTFNMSTNGVTRIVVHVRKGDIIDTSPKYLRRQIHDFDVLRVVNYVMKQHSNAVVHLCYNKPFESSRYKHPSSRLGYTALDEFRAAISHLVLHEDDDLSTEWPRMAHADVLIIARSSYSGLPSMFNSKDVWHPITAEEAKEYAATHDYIKGRDVAGSNAYFAGTPVTNTVQCSFIGAVVNRTTGVRHCAHLMHTQQPSEPPSWISAATL